MYCLKKKKGYWYVCCGKCQQKFPVSEHLSVAWTIYMVLLKYRVPFCHVADVIEDLLSGNQMENKKISRKVCPEVCIK